MRILCVGGAGFIGANLSLYLAGRGHNVTALDNLVRRGGELNLPDFKKAGIKFIHGDIRNKEDISGNYDVILECSAQPSATAGYDNPMFDFNNNVVGLMNVLEHARKTGAAVIFWSTNKVYSGDRINDLPYEEYPTRFDWVKEMPILDLSLGPTGFDYNFGISNHFDIDGGQHSVYGMTKAMSDLAVQEYADAFGVKTIVNRFSCLAGPRQWGKTEQGWVSWFAIAKHLGLPVKVCGWGGKQVRDILFIDDICNLIDIEIDRIKFPDISGQVFNIGGGRKNSISILESFTRLGLTPASVESERKGDHRIYITDNSKAKNVLGWEPKVGLDEGFEQIEKWVVDNKSILESLYK